MAAQPHQQEHAIDESCLEPFKYLTQIPGKDVRGLLIDCFQSWLEIPEDKLIGIKDIIASLHNASLLVDDIEDNSKLRRGVPVAHHIYGIANTINCANYVYCLALEKCHLLNSPQAMQVFVQELLNLHRGQGQDILWRDQHVCPTEEQYKGMVIDKTGGLFRLAVGLMQAFSCNHNANTDFRPLLDVLALYFQIRDDMLNVSSSEYMQTKSFCEDLTEGKFSYPILLAIRAVPTDTRLINILRQRTEDENVKRHAVQWMKRVGAIDQTREVLRDLRQQVEEAIAALGGHPKLLGLLIHLDAQLDKKSDEITPDLPPLPHGLTRKADDVGTGMASSSVSEEVKALSLTKPRSESSSSKADSGSKDGSARKMSAGGETPTLTEIIREGSVHRESLGEKGIEKVTTL